jgi:hypothetical protein
MTKIIIPFFFAVAGTAFAADGPKADAAPA